MDVIVLDEFSTMACCFEMVVFISLTLRINYAAAQEDYEYPRGALLMVAQCGLSSGARLLARYNCVL